MLAGKRILLGISGGIAGYKIADLASRLSKAGADVHVVMTEAATQFVTPQVLRTLTRNPVNVDFFAEPSVGNVGHIALAEQADLAIVAPATANIIAKMAVGIADDFLSTVLLAVTSPLFIAPAMNHRMYHHPATQHNLAVLRERGIKIIGPDSGFQACGTEGDGRMSEPAAIIEYICDYLKGANSLQGHKIIVTAGGTQEPLDPVRYLGNRSSGKMGYAIARAFAEAGGEVMLISAPTSLPCPEHVKLVAVNTAQEMYDAVLSHYDDADVVIKAAAVADYRPALNSEHKIKKLEQGERLTIELIPNPDILSELGKRKTKQILVGFAAETHNLKQYAQAKLERKNLDMLVANDVSMEGAGFGTDTNIVSLLFRDGSIKDLPIMNKLEIARKLVQEVVALLEARDKE